MKLISPIFFFLNKSYVKCSMIESSQTSDPAPVISTVNVMKHVFRARPDRYKILPTVAISLNVVRITFTPAVFQIFVDAFTISVI